MSKTMFCNSFEIGHTKEVLCLILKFMRPDGTIVETVHVAISPSGAKTLTEQLALEMKDYEKEHGQVEVWSNVGKPNSNNQNSDKNKTYVS